MLRSRDVTINKGRDNENNPSSSKSNTEKQKEKQKEKDVQKIVSNKGEVSKEVKQPTPIDVDKGVSSFNLKSDLSKINISIPFKGLLINNEYR